MAALILVALRSELDLPELPENVVLTGIGKVNAAIAAAHTIAERRPSLVINYGTAGGVRCTPQQLVEVGAVIQRDADIEPLAPRGELLGEGPRLDSGAAGLVCGSGDSFVRRRDPWLLERCDVVDMELWGIAKACARAGVPWRAIKWVSDAADEGSPEAWQRSVHLGTEAAVEWLRRRGHWRR